MDKVHHHSNRRQFIQGAGSLAAMGIAGPAPRSVSFVLDPRDPVVAAGAVQWAAKEFQEALADRGITVFQCEKTAEAKAGDLCVLAAGSAAMEAVSALKQARTIVASTPEALAIVPASIGKTRVIAACGYDSAGLTYALLELADRVRNADDPFTALTVPAPINEQPANRVRSITRLFTSDVEDKPWYNDREMWPRYLTMLASQRFNRFNLALGMGYDFIRQVTDAYFVFAYPFLVSVPGYQVGSPQLPNDERDRNLQMLKFISEQAVARGMEFQLGLWMHGYEWIDSPNPNYTIAGVTKANHGPYCRDALRMLLQACPAISGVTFRVHGESGVDEGSYDFWKTVFDGAVTCGRRVRIDMHAKGMDRSMLAVGVKTGLPLTVSPKFWAEHMGMAYHQADIRKEEQPKAGKATSALMRLSAGSRSFLRYGYGDLMREDRQWSIVHRIWPGTQRLLVWGDPVTAAGYSRAFKFSGSDGVEICEPLSFKGRRGSGLAGDRCAYADATLKPRWDWEKYVYGTRVWGRLLYNPSSDPDVWRRYLRKQFEGGSSQVEEALANASRILPIVTTAYGPSAANNSYWPEIYTNQSMVDAAHPEPYPDTPAPKVFGNASPFDPQLFSRINDFADELLSGERTAKYSPLEVAQWIEDYADAATKRMEQAELSIREKERAEYRRLAVDVALQAGLGHFFAAKFRSGVLYGLYEKTGDERARVECLRQYREARAKWAALAERAKGVYLTDITVGEHPQLRGHWLDRLPAIDRDIQEVEKSKSEAKGDALPQVAAAIQEVLGRPVRVKLAATHRPPEHFVPGQPLNITFVPGKAGASVVLYYRHVNQAERFQTAKMAEQGNRYTAEIPGTYTDSAYPLQYYFEVRESSRSVLLHPGFSATLTNQPYFLVRRGAGEPARTA